MPVSRNKIRQVLFLPLPVILLDLLVLAHISIVWQKSQSEVDNTKFGRGEGGVLEEASSHMF